MYNTLNKVDTFVVQLIPLFNTTFSRGPARFGGSESIQACRISVYNEVYVSYLFHH
jgi:hypothetical protein